MRSGTNAVLRSEEASSRALSERQMNHYATAQPCRKRAASLLVIGANVEDRVAISETLGNDAYEIVFCDSLALPDMDVLEGRPFDACIITLSHSVETSFDLLAAIKRTCPVAEVVILSRLAEEDLWIESIQRGAYDFL